MTWSFLFKEFHWESKGIVPLKPWFPFWICRENLLYPLLNSLQAQWDSVLRGGPGYSYVVEDLPVMWGPGFHPQHHQGGKITFQRPFLNASVLTVLCFVSLSARDESRALHLLGCATEPHTQPLIVFLGNLGSHLCLTLVLWFVPLIPPNFMSHAINFLKSEPLLGVVLVEGYANHGGGSGSSERLWCVSDLRHSICSKE